MPGRDQTGPMGQGPMTGRGMGICGGVNARGAGYGFGRGCGMGFGGGRGFGGGFGRGRGFGMGRGYFANNAAAGYPAQAPSAADELEMLKAQAQNLSESLSQIQNRIDQIEKQSE